MSSLRCMAGALLVGLACAWTVLPGSDPATGFAEEHDFWLAPSSYRPATGSSVDISILVGHPSRHTRYARNPHHIRRFVAAFGDSLLIIEGTPGRDPAGSVTFRSPGIAVIGYSSRATSTTLPAARFEAYLREEGLDDVVAERERSGESRRPGRETFSRSAKSLIQVGGIGDAGYDRRLGFPFELVPERNPYVMSPGDSLPVRLFFRGKPIAGSQVVAVHVASGQSAATQRTDDHGIASLALDRAGEWMIKSVHMIQVEGDASADWESIWATLTFELSTRPVSQMQSPASSNP